MRNGINEKESLGVRDYYRIERMKDKRRKNER